MQSSSHTTSPDVCSSADSRIVLDTGETDYCTKIDSICVGMNVDASVEFAVREITGKHETERTDFTTPPQPSATLLKRKSQTELSSAELSSAELSNTDSWSSPELSSDTAHKKLHAPISTALVASMIADRQCAKRNKTKRRSMSETSTPLAKRGAVKVLSKDASLTASNTHIVEDAPTAEKDTIDQSKQTLSKLISPGMHVFELGFSLGKQHQLSKTTTTQPTTHSTMQPTARQETTVQAEPEEKLNLFKLLEYGTGYAKVVCLPAHKMHSHLDKEKIDRLRASLRMNASSIETSLRDLLSDPAVLKNFCENRPASSELLKEAFRQLYNHRELLEKNPAAVRLAVKIASSYVFFLQLEVNWIFQHFLTYSKISSGCVEFIKNNLGKSKMLGKVAKAIEWMHRCEKRKELFARRAAKFGNDSPYVKDVVKSTEAAEKLPLDIVTSVELGYVEHVEMKEWDFDEQRSGEMTQLEVTSQLRSLVLRLQNAKQYNDILSCARADTL